MPFLLIQEGRHYQINSLTGALESFEKERYDMIRASYLKYSSVLSSIAPFYFLSPFAFIYPPSSRQFLTLLPRCPPSLSYSLPPLLPSHRTACNAESETWTASLSPITRPPPSKASNTSLSTRWTSPSLATRRWARLLSVSTSACWRRCSRRLRDCSLSRCVSSPSFSFCLSRTVGYGSLVRELLDLWDR
jgi:hypothetical protein